MNAEEQATLEEKFNKAVNDPSFAEMIEKGLTTVREQKGITDAEMNAVYAVAHNFYMTGRYEDAETVFKFLVIFDHLNPKYWIGLGAVRQVGVECIAAPAVNLGKLRRCEEQACRTNELHDEQERREDRHEALRTLVAEMAIREHTNDDGNPYDR